MNGKTHAAAGLLTAELIILTQPQISQETVGMCLLSGAIASLLNDFDHENGTVTRIFKIRWLSRLLEHRGFTHSIWMVIFLSLFLFFFPFPFPFPLIIKITIIACYLSHDGLDMLTKKGIRWLYPSDKHYRIINIFKYCRSVESRRIAETFFRSFLYFLVFFIPIIPMLYSHTIQLGLLRTLGTIFLIVLVVNNRKLFHQIIFAVPFLFLLVYSINNPKSVQQGILWLQQYVPIY